MTSTKHGDFTTLAENYSSFRPTYSNLVRDALAGLQHKPTSEIDFVDIGAGTGIWTRKFAELSINSAIAVEPNDAMREFGIKDSTHTNIQWKAGSGEVTGLESNSADILTMASSFHWVDFEKGLAEFSRVIRPGGLFGALWNPRKIEENPLLVEIEEKLYSMAPNMRRVSSGRSEFTDTLLARLAKHELVEDVIYVEGQHIAQQSPEHYLGVWWSVNDIRVQLGEALFAEFMSWVERRISNEKVIETTYLTRAWIAKMA